jgi:tetratricopeptide (TPR) repeat protein
MKPTLLACAVLLMSSIFAFAADDAGSSARAAEDVAPLLDKAIDELVKVGYLGDTSAPERYLAAVLEQQPENLEARWQLLSVRLMPLKNVPLSERAAALAALSPEFGRLAKLARTSKQDAFLHYLTAIHAGFYKDYERALAEIDKAVALDRRSVRYLTAKGRLLAERGEWTRSDKEIEAGIVVLQAARELLRAQPSPFVRDADYEFYLAMALEDMTKPRWPDVVEHYQRFIAASAESLRQAFAWNNTSLAYQKLGECGKAKEAAEKALAIAKFGMAQRNRQRSEFCLEMQAMEVVARPQEASSAPRSPAGAPQ